MDSNLLDLHGMRYDDARLKVEEFLYSTELPCSIITGNSIEMRKIVKQEAEKLGLKLIQLNPNNFGKVTVTK